MARADSSGLPVFRSRPASAGGGFELVSGEVPDQLPTCQAPGCSRRLYPPQRGGELCPLCQAVWHLRLEVLELDEHSVAAEGLLGILKGCVRLANNANLERAEAEGSLDEYRRTRQYRELNASWHRS